MSEKSRKDLPRDETKVLLGSNYFYPEEFAKTESDLVEMRRQRARESRGLKKWAREDRALTGDVIGVACSGGGIRSATFCLGFFQGLAKLKDRDSQPLHLLKHFDFLSTVSGGGYFGGFFSRLVARGVEPGSRDESASPEASTAAAVEAESSAVHADGDTRSGVEHAEDVLEDNHSAEITWLRNHGRYISPTGAGDSLVAIAVFLRNWMTLHLVLGGGLLLLFHVTHTVRAGLWEWWSSWEAFEGVLRARASMGIWWSPSVLVVFGLVVLAIVPLGWAYWLAQRDPRVVRSHTPVMASVILIGSSASYVVWSLSDQVGPPGSGRWALTAAAGALSVSGIVAFICWGLARFGQRPASDLETARMRNRLSIWLSRWLLVAGVSLVFVVIDSLGQSLWAVRSTGGGTRILAALSSIVAGAAGFATIARSISDRIATRQKSQGESRLRVPWTSLAGVASLLLWGTLIVVYSTASHAVLWRGQAPSPSLGPTIAEAWDSGPVSGPLRVDADGVVTVERASSPPATEAVEDQATPMSPGVMLLILVVGSVVLWLVSIDLRFVNSSSHQKLYAARLIRAYLGASNPARQEPEGRKLSRVIEGDNLLMDKHRPHEEGGPIHLVNVTINETIEGRSQIEQRDRKGLPMCVGPIGMNAGRHYHATWREESPVGQREGEVETERRDDSGRSWGWDVPKRAGSRWVEIEPVPLPQERELDPEARRAYHLFRPETQQSDRELVERMSLGSWLSISGAAFSTGLGSKTSLGISSLLGFINVRLGYWWDSGIDPMKRGGVAPGAFERLSRRFVRALPAHAYLLDEILARFHGPNRRRWYLSDGGHFENTGCYELLRRRVPLIVALDCGADPNYDFADLANLVRKARIDFGAEIEFFGQEEIDKHVDPDINRYFGTPAQIRRQARDLKEGEADDIFHGRSYSRKHAALAQVWFPGDRESGSPTSEILWIKPSMVGDEPIDLRNYHGKNPAFPQETTADQYFDEAQWESYRRLGEGIAARLFYDDPRPEESWTPLRWFVRKRKLDTFINPVPSEVGTPAHPDPARAGSPPIGGEDRLRAEERDLEDSREDQDDAHPGEDQQAQRPEPPRER